MRSTMQETPLGISTLLRFASTAYSRTPRCTPSPPTACAPPPFAEVGARAAQLAHALRDDLGIDGDQRVATFMWNNAEHLEAYLAVPSMGAVLHTLNIRLFPEQLTLHRQPRRGPGRPRRRHAVPLLARCCRRSRRSSTCVVVGDGRRRRALEPAGKQIHALRGAARRPARRPSTGRSSTSATPPPCATPPAPPATPRASSTATARSTCTRWRCTRHAVAIGLTDDRVLPIVPMFHANAWGLPYAALMAGATLVMPDRFLQAEPLVRLIDEPSGRRRRRACRRSGTTCCSHARRAPATRPLAARGAVRRLGRPAGADAGLRGALRRAHHPRLGHDRDLAARLASRQPPAGAEPARRTGPTASRQGRFPAGVEARLIGAGRRGRCPGTARRSASSRSAARGSPPPTTERRAIPSASSHDGWLRTGDVGTIDPRRLHHPHRPRQGRHQVRRRVDLLGRPGEPPDGATRTSPRRPWSASRTSGGRSGRWPRSCCARAPTADSAGAARASSPTGSPSGSCRSAGPSSTGCPKTCVGKFDKKEVRRQYAAGDLEVTVL